MNENGHKCGKIIISSNFCVSQYLFERVKVDGTIVQE